MRLTTVHSDKKLNQLKESKQKLKNEILDPKEEEEIDEEEELDEDDEMNSDEEILSDQIKPMEKKEIKILNNIKIDATDAVDFVLMMGEQKDSSWSIPKTKKSSENNSLRRHSCEVCSKKFMKKSNLIDHLRLHANMKPYQCDYCEKSFVQSGNYKTHLRTHTQERPFTCSFPGCNKNYNQSSALRIHIRSHTNEKNYICGKCQKAFTNSSDLKKHEGIHDEVKKYQCDTCSKSYAQKSHLTKHELSAHTKSPAKKKSL